MQGNSSCQHTKIFGHSFLRAFIKNYVNVESFIMIFAYREKADLCTWHYDKKKNAPHFFYLKLAVNFSFIQRSLKRLSVAEWNGKNTSFFQWINLVAEIAEELRPQHPQPEAFDLCVMSKEEQSSHFNVVILKKLCVTLKYHSNPGKEKETKLTNFRLSYKIAGAFLHQLRSEHRDP